MYNGLPTRSIPDPYRPAEGLDPGRTLSHAATAAEGYRFSEGARRRCSWIVVSRMHRKVKKTAWGRKDAQV
jgi:hypothetical protein